MKKLLLSLAFCFSVSAASAATIQFDLRGTGGFGLLPTNEPPVPVIVGGGTGGELLGLGGITYDDVSRSLIINVGWGSANGFTNLSSAASASHIHGPTTTANGNGFTETAGVLPTIGTLIRSSNDPSSGTILAASNPIILSIAQQAELYAGRYYVNVHTANNGGGEIRGFLVQVPEPATGLLGIASMGLLALRRRRA